MTASKQSQDGTGVRLLKTKEGGIMVLTTKYP
jgi:hypothetical protein